ncbi:MAG: hypothetical protein ACI9MR_002323 [Myxococcota bacterium]|jgi:hypothetical protein
MKRVMLVWTLVISACASVPPTPDVEMASARAAIADGDAGGWLQVTRLILRHGPVVGRLPEALAASERAAHAGNLEGTLWAMWLARAVGDDRKAWRYGMQLALRDDAPSILRVVGAQELLRLVDRVTLVRDDLEALSTAWRVTSIDDRVGARLAELGEAVAIRLNSWGIVEASRRRMGAISRFAVSARLSRLPALASIAPLASELTQLPEDVAPTEVERPQVLPAGFRWVDETPDGRVASGHWGEGLYAVLVPLDARSTDEGLRDLGSDRVTVEIESGAAWTAWVSGREIARNPRLTEVRPTRTAFEAPAGGVLELHLADRTPGIAARVFVRPRRSSKAAKAAPMEGVSPGAFDEAAWASVAASLAVHDGDGVALAAARSQFEADTPWAAWWLAQTIEADPTWPADHKRARAQRLYRDILAVEPSFAAARARLVEDIAATGDARTADALAATGPLGDYAAWVNAEPNLHAQIPTSCGAWAQWFEQEWEALSLSKTAVNDAPGCAAVQRQVARLAVARWRLADAQAVLERERLRASPGPARAEVLRALARVAASAGDVPRATALVTLALAEGGDQEVSLSMLHGYALLGSDAGETQAQLDAIQSTLGTLDTVSLSARFEHLDPARDLGLPLDDGAVMARAAYASGDGDASLGSYEVLLDDRYTRVYPDGAMAHRVHRVVRLLDARAVESFGEIALPEDAELLVARTWLPDGNDGVRPVAPEEFIEKTSVSLPELSTGTVAEVAWFWLERPRLWRRPGFRVGPLALESADGPTRLSRVAIRPPAGRSVDAVSWAGAPPLVLGEDGVYRVLVRDRPRVQAEPLDPRPDRRIASVVLQTTDAVDRVSARLRDGVVTAVVVSPAVEAAARAAVEGVDPDSPRTVLKAIQSWVAGNIQEAGSDVAGANATHAALERSGDRAVLTAAMARARGLEAEVVLARPLAYGLVEVTDFDLSNYAYPVVRVWLPAVGEGERTAVWLDTANRFSAFDYLPPLVQGVAGLTLGRVAGPVTTPAMASKDGGRVIDMQVDVRDAAGNWVVERVDTLTGLFAASWRNALSEYTPTARERVLEQVLQQSLPGASVTAVSVEGLDEAVVGADKRPLVLRWTATGTLAATNSGFALTVGLDPESVGHRTVKLPTRSAPLLINRANRSRVRLRLTVPSGFRVPHAPEPVVVSHPLLAVSRRSVLGVGGQLLEVLKTYGLSAGIVPPDGYPAWREAAQRADRSEVLYIVVEPTGVKVGAR